jgi:radical SAM protein with 4Fe4S-binding SPASM domain
VPAALCNAPLTSLYLDQRGNVRACCMNDAHRLGNITEQSLWEIWSGARAEALREAVAADDLSLGCQFCEKPVRDGRPDLAFARWFDQLDPSGPPTWPRQIEFALTNTCNLQCVQCNGDWSSSIRAQREGLAPLPEVWGDAFFDELDDFLPHLDQVRFLGGEPFLANETLRIMDQLRTTGATARVHVTTNGTQWTPRVERILDALAVDLAVSVDAATPATYEAIRVGASWDRLQANLDRFAALSERRGTHVSLTFCLMRSNWHEFGAFCRMADERGFSCDVNTVRDPEHLSLFALGADDLCAVISALEAEAADEGLTREWNRRTWRAELDRLRADLEERGGAGDRRVMIRPYGAADEERRRVEVAARRARATDRRLELFGEDAARIDLDGDQIVFATSADGVLGVEAPAFEGRTGDQVVEVLGRHLAPVVAMEVEDEVDEDHLLRLELGDGRAIRVLSTPALAADGRRIGTTVYLAWLPHDRVAG